MKIVNMEPQHEYDPEEDEDMESRPGPSRDEARRRLLRLLVARLKERIPLVSMAKVAEEAEDMIEELGLLMREYTAKIQGLDQESYDGDVLIRRMANTVRKLAAALARLEGRDYVTSADLDKVWEMVIPKLEVVRWMCGPDAQLRPLGTREQQIKKALWASEQRFRQMMAQFGGKKVSAEDLAKALGCAEVTVRRDLGRRRIQPEGNDYLIPYASDWAPDEERDSVLTPEVAQPVMEMKEVEAAQERELYPRKDCIERPPQEVRKPAKLIELADDGALHRAQRALVGLMLDPEPQEPYPRGMLVDQVAQASSRAAEQHEIPHRWEHLYIARWLETEDWEERAMRAISLYAEGLGVNKDRWWLFDGLEELQAKVNQRVEERGPLPDRIAQGIGALYTRILYFRERQEEIYRRRARA
jgi:hypothetical protein